MMHISKKKQYDAIVVGAGPIGASIASQIAKSGFDVMLLEEHEEIGEPVQCAGIVSSRLSQLTPINLPVLNKVKGGRIIPPSGKPLILKSNKPKALVIDRGLFDREMVNAATSSGSEIITGARCTGMYYLNSLAMVTVKGKNLPERELTAKLVIGADGPHSIIRRSLDIGRPQEMLHGIQIEVPKNLVPDLGSDEVEVRFGTQVAPGFFSWLIPAGGSIRIGLCTAGGQYPKKYFNHLLKDMDISIEEGHSLTSGSIPLGLLARSHADNVMLAGDAACQVKPLTAGGLVFGLMCAGHCAETAIESLELEDQSQNFLKRYHDRWTGQIGKEIKQAMLLRRVFQGLDDDEINQIVDVLRDEKTLSFLASEGDMDFPVIASKTVLRKLPKLVKFAPHLLKALL